MVPRVALCSLLAGLSAVAVVCPVYGQEVGSQDAKSAVTGSAATPAKAAPVKQEEEKHSLFGKKKEVYTGPTEIIVLAPTPMLDEEGKQRLDPDGKPMFNAPVKQQRDKYGHPLFDEKGKPVFQTKTELGYDEHGKKIHVEKVKPPKLTPVTISRGTFTVDGVIGKAGLNYDIADLKFIYLSVPGAGVTIVSNEPFPGATKQPSAFDGKTLTVKANDHTLQLASDKKLLGPKQKVPVDGYVMVDRDFQLPSRYPEVGYGTTSRSPYMWPGSRRNGELNGLVAPPPVPENLQPVHLLSSCPTGQMRMPAPPTLPGEKPKAQPCVPIAQAEAARKAMEAKAAGAAK